MSDSGPVPIALIDDHTLVRKGLVELIERAGGYRVVLEAGNGREFVNAIAKAPPVSIAIVDLNMPVMNGYETIAWIRLRRPEILPLALTFDGTEGAMIKAMRNGARGFILKDIEPYELKQALDEIMITGYYHTDLVKHNVVAASDRGSRRGMKRVEILQSISTRELDFLKLVCSDIEYTYDEIAIQLGVHRRTLDGYREALFKKFDVKSKTGLVIYAMKWGIIKP